MPVIEAVGVYRVEAEEPVHLVELLVQDAQGVFKIGDITQVVSGQPADQWQSPYLEVILNAAGDEILADDYEAPNRPELWLDTMRLAFFFHYLDFGQPLLTPFGEVRLPAEAELPNRLSILEYEAP